MPGLRPDDYSPLYDVFSAAEAARLWGLDESTVKKACEQGRMIHVVECKKSGRPWLVTRAGMERLWGGRDQREGDKTK